MTTNTKKQDRKKINHRHFLMAVVAGIVAVGLVMGCAGTGTAATPPVEPAPDPPDPAATGRIVQADNELGFRLFKELFTGEPEKNLFINSQNTTMKLF